MTTNGDQEKNRFQIELEFIQCLANPWYLNNLAQQQYFKDPEFINYLKYLMYWKQPEYAKFVMYPHALHFLDLLQYPQFREYISTSENAQEIHRMQYYHWMYLRNPPKALDDQGETTRQTDPSGFPPIA
ncbi:mediator of RNA polymerase II transcription subunit 31-like protein [Halteromyces radiatus]|uniref:mediator of RNA polymerase II transcription subunit 31-like protein n=1 Tax=Halteromyces radiatus TaxID=101107 RepID=UPI002220926A|nr:mediator of RNA polymerase II transcription subunit 31-like protein [Halteromyces radiatus]KAI8093920.1 mediator of RNA polymerase II transcription subunit 31-like protein [Halteromyces radiatus]